MPAVRYNLTQFKLCAVSFAVQNLRAFTNEGLFLSILCKVNRANASAPK